MTVRLLKPYAQRPAGAITSALDVSTEAGLIAAGKASADLTGGTRYFLPKSGIALQPKVVAVGSVNLKMEEQTTITLPEGQVLNVTGGAGTVGEISRAGSSDKWAIGAGALPSIGPFSGTQKLTITCTAGSVDANVAQAVATPSAIAAATYGPLRRRRGSAVLCPLPFFQTQNIGAGNGTGQSIDNEWAVDGGFIAVQAVLGNWNPAAPLVVTKASLAASPRSLTPTQASLANVPLLFGGALGASIPAATGVSAAGDNPTDIVPGRILTDVLAAADIPRLDAAGAKPLLRSTIVVPDNSIIGINGNPADWTTYNSDPIYAGRSVAVYKQNGDKVAAPAGTNVLVTGGLLALLGLKLFYKIKCFTIGEAGDSLLQGVGSTGKYGGGVLRACAQLSHAARIVSPLRSAMGGQKHENSIRHAQAMLSATPPDVLVVAINSINNTPYSQATVDASWQAILSLKEQADAAGVLLYLITTTAVGFVGSQETARLNGNQRARDFCAVNNVLLLDAATLMDNGNALKAEFDSGDHVHYNDAGHLARASAMVTSLDPLLQ